MVKYRNIALIILIIFSFLSLSCQKENKMKELNYIVSEKAPLKKTPKRVVSVSPAVTEIMFLLECGDKLVGKTEFCNYPPQTKNIQSIGGINNANLEMIIALKPDLVITSSIFTKKMFEIIENASIPIMSFQERNSIERMYDIIEIIGNIMDREAKAKEIIYDFKQNLSKIKQDRETSLRAKGISSLPKIYYVVGFGQGGDFSAGKDTYINEIIELAGGDNVAKKSVNWSFSTEELFANQPDFIFVRKEDSAIFVNTHPYNQLNAVKENRAFGIESGLMDIQTPRTLDAIKYISNIISTISYL